MSSSNLRLDPKQIPDVVGGAGNSSTKNATAPLRQDQLDFKAIILNFVIACIPVMSNSTLKSCLTHLGAGNNLSLTPEL